MNLPDLDFQLFYGRLSWALVLASLLCACWPRAWPLSRVKLAAVALGAVVLQFLPGQGSPAYWLGLAFQWPSALLVGLSLVKLHFAWQGKPEQGAMTPALAALIALSGLALYLDAMGLLAFGFYYSGFGPRGAPLLALLLAALCTVAIVRGFARAQASALLGAVLVFSLSRLPTGNLWDALLDPLLWGWALLSLAGHGLHKLKGALRPRLRAATTA
jgi:hypothetical protein